MRKMISSVAIAAALVVPTIVRAADATPTTATAVAAPAAAPAAEPAVNTGALSLSGGVDIPSQYVFRGYQISDTGFIAQPWAQLNVAAYKADSGMTITPYIGLWTDMQSTPADGSNSAWQEADVYGGVDFGVGDFTLGVIYTFYTYPGGLAATNQELGLKATYAEKTDLPVTFKPYIAWYFELDNPAGQQYAEVGANPTYAIKDTPFSISVPIALGFSPEGYYTNDSGGNVPFGYVSIGGYVNYALPVASKWGAWNVYAGLTYYYLNATSARDSNGGDTTYQLLAKGGIAFTY